MVSHGMLVTVALIYTVICIAAIVLYLRQLFRMQELHANLYKLLLSVSSVRPKTTPEDVLDQITDWCFWAQGELPQRIKENDDKKAA